MTERIDAKDYAKLSKGKSWSNAKIIDTPDGKFRSIGEHNRWKELRLLQSAREIENLSRQVKFEIRVNGFHIKTYSADYTYYDKKFKRFVIEDFKGRRSREWILTKKLLIALYPQWEVLETMAARR